MYIQGKLTCSPPWLHTELFCRHYVAFIRKEIPDERSIDWVLYNDEKVVKALDIEEMKKFAYVYFFKRT